MAARGTPYTGFLYAGLMLTAKGPKTLEFNCRFGDPETQPILFRLQSDLVELCLLATQGQLNKATAQWDPRPALGVVMASRNYPDHYPKGEVITGLEQKNSDVKVFHAGTTLQENNVVTDGGRVLCVTALGADLKAAQQNAYAAAKMIHWPSAFYRTDIGAKAIYTRSV
jgi:phosphoribosylamine--glycine ligase